MLKPLRKTECDSPGEIVKQINVLRAVTNDLAELLAKITAPPTPVLTPPTPAPAPPTAKPKTHTFRKGD